ncbi:MAG TPA: S-methyl-5-thioribose-1-phosphate isomerase [Ktedonobacteraceae bacterium]|jgi:methylthioribose-1-phosphate isomerase
MTTGTGAQFPADIRVVSWEEGIEGNTVCLLDQSALPHRVCYLQLASEGEVAEAIRSLRVRGAPAIGVTAAFGMALALWRLWRVRQGALTPAEARIALVGAADLLCQARPTAVNLPWAVQRMLRCADAAFAAGRSPAELVECLQREARTVAAEDAAACLAMGRYGAALIPDGARLLTHCNAGALATAGLGTALAPVYIAHRAGKRLHVFVDETRPVLQGARLTAWELARAGIPLTLITDSMAAHFMRHAGITAIFVGADRIAANGDVANKIGTYGLAVLAQAHAIPFYVVAPRSTVDLSLATGEQIPIEQRDPSEVTTVGGSVMAPAGVHAANPAFDVTPHLYVTALITEAGIARAPYTESLPALCAGYHHVEEVSE